MDNAVVNSCDYLDNNSVFGALEEDYGENSY